MSDLRRDFEGQGKPWGGMIISQGGNPVGYIPTEEKEMDEAYEQYTKLRNAYSELIRMETCLGRIHLLERCIERLDEDNK